MSFNPRIVLFGPPAVGKSTLLRHVLLLDDPRVEFAAVLDLEAIPIATRHKAATDAHSWNVYGPLFVGPADLHPPKHFAWNDWRIVGLIPEDRDLYLRRVEERDRVNPKKAGQDAERHWTNIRNLVLDNRDKAAAIFDPLEFDNKPEQLLRLIMDAV